MQLGVISVIRMLIVAIHLEATLVSAEMVFLEMEQTVTVINTLLHIHAYTIVAFDLLLLLLLLFAAGIGPIIDTSESRGNHNTIECMSNLFCLCYNTVRPNHDLEYTIGTNFCLETESPLNTMMSQNWVVSCQLANEPIPPPNFKMTIEVVKTEIETELSMPTDINLVFYDLNSTINSLLEQDTSAIRVTCIVSNDFGSDNATTMIEPCGN